MKITKGVKWTNEQKAKHSVACKTARIRKIKALENMQAEIERLKAEIAFNLQIIVNLKNFPEIKCALEYFQKEFYEPAKPELSEVAFMLLKLALTQPEQLTVWKHAHVKYRRDEGFNGVPDADSKILSSRIAGRKEYRDFAKQ